MRTIIFFYSMKNLTFLGKYWGKAEFVPSISPCWHSLVYHSLDVAAMACSWLEIKKSVRQMFCHAFSAEEQKIFPWICFFIAMHDLGKCDIRFQLKSLDALTMAWPGFDPDSADKALGFNHGDAGYRWGMNECADWAGLKDRTTLKEAWQPWLQAVTGHHGEYFSLSERMAKPEDDDGSIAEHDRLARLEFVKTMESLFLLPAGLSLSDHPPHCTPAAQSLLAGFCSICDWVGSNRQVSPYKGFESSLAVERYFAKRLEEVQSSQWLNKLGLCHDAKTYGGIESLLPDGGSPRGLQVKVGDLPVKPGLTVVEAPTGSGKTEAALAYAWRLLGEGVVDSIVFALPTQATANAMVKRAMDFSGKVYPDAPVNVVLAHGNRDFNHDFEKLVQAGQRVDAQGQEEARLQCAAWLAQSRKRVFLGQLGVCTIDQVLLSVLPVRHKFVRGYGLGKSVLIVDEVHAYDAYMYGLLTEVLRRQREMGGSALLLSATLPMVTRNLLLDAWKGVSSKVMDYPAIWHCPSCAMPEEAREAQLPLVPITLPEDRRPLEKTIQIETIRLPKAMPDDALLDRITKAAEGGAKVAVILNLVDAAQSVARALKGRTNIPVDLFHARYRFWDRSERERQVISFYGREASRDGGRILVATQVVEQSLDLDFDWMVTQICPVDLLFQRLGRLHRHEWRKGRPPDFDIPRSRCTVVSVTDGVFCPHNLIYGNVRVLWNTDRLLLEGKAVFPEAYRDWIEQAYAHEPREDEPELVTGDYLAWKKDQEYATRQAQQLISTPRLSSFEDDAAITVKTRDGEMGLTLLPLLGDGRLLDGTVIFGKEEREIAEAVALNSIPVPKGWASILEKVQKDDEGRYVPRFCKAEGGFHFQDGPCFLRYSAEYGLERE